MATLRDQPVFSNKRMARFTAAGHDEIELTHPFEGVAGHQENGKQQHVFYSADRYEAKQLDYGHEIYPIPAPFTDGRFIR